MAGRGKRKLNDDNGFGEWGGYMAAKVSKLENQYSNELNGGQESVKLSNIFSSIAIFVNGYTSPTAEELKRLMLAHGGTYHHYYNSKTTTHIIASNLCDAKIQKLKGDEKFIKPEWICDSINANKLLDFKPYLLYSVTKLDRGQTKLDTFSHSKTNDGQHFQNDASKKPNDSHSMLETGSSSSDKLHHREMKRAGEDDFLSEFYKRSRLHHISTMGALFKRHVTELREKSDGIFPGIETLENWKKNTGCLGNHKMNENVFMHIDMDCFFVSVGLRNYPSLRGKPVVVTHARADSKPQARREGCNREFEFDCYREHWIKKSKFAENINDDEKSVATAEIFPRLQDLDETCSMSEIASCSYEARAAGIYNGMFMGGALKLCPNLVAIPYDFEGYKEVSTLLYNTVATYTLDIEAVSCDELYADITSVLHQSGLAPSEFATHLKEVIFSKTKCNASVGMGSNMLMARLATKKAKPNGIFYLNKIEMSEFMKCHKVEDLPGVGRSMAHRLHSIGINTCVDMQQMTLGKLQNEFGKKQGQTLYYMCRGEDKRTLKTDHVRKSISADINYGIRFANDQEMCKFVHELSTEVSKRMEEIHVRGRLLTLKLKIRAKDAPIETAKFMGHGVCDSISRSTTLTVATRDTKIIEKEVTILLKQLQVNCSELRGMGIGFSKLVSDNLSKGKQPMQNFLLNFVARSKTTHSQELVPQPLFPCPTVLESSDENIAPNVLSECNGKGTESIISIGITNPIKEDEKKITERSLFELPSASQIDPTVFNELPEDLKNDIIQDYQRKGIAIDQIGSTVSSHSELTPNELSKIGVAGPSSRASSNSIGTSKIDNSVPYDGIDEITDIDAAYWSAIPDDIKAEIERDIQQRKAESTSPKKEWKNIFKGQRSPVKTVEKFGKRTTKPQETLKTKLQPTARVPTIQQQKGVKEIDVPKIAEGIKEDLSLSGATSLPEIRELLTEWFLSTEIPENEDCQIVSNYLVNLIHNKELHKIESIILFMKRKSIDKNDLWKRAIEDIINNAQLYVIQFYNAPLKLS